MLGKLTMHCFQPMAAYPLQSASNSNDFRLRESAHMRARIDSLLTSHKLAACTLHVVRTGDMLGKLTMHCFQPMAAYPLQSASNLNDARLRESAHMRARIDAGRFINGQRAHCMSFVRATCLASSPCIAFSRWLLIRFNRPRIQTISASEKVLTCALELIPYSPLINWQRAHCMLFVRATCLASSPCIAFS